MRTASGRVFCVEPVDERVNHSQSWGWYEGLEAAEGGAVAPADSIITEANGYTNIVTLPRGTSPLGYIENLLAAEQADGQP